MRHHAAQPPWRKILAARPTGTSRPQKAGRRASGIGASDALAPLVRLLARQAAHQFFAANAPEKEEIDGSEG